MSIRDERVGFPTAILTRRATHPAPDASRILGAGTRLGFGHGGKNGHVGLTMAVTGPTGEIGISAVTALEREPAVEKIVGMARRPFDPSTHGWTKTIYQQG